MRKIITQIVVFTLIFSVIFAIVMGFMHSAFIPSDLAEEYKSDIITMFIRGLRMDLKVILIGFAPLLLLGYVALLWRFAQGKTHLHILERLRRIARRIYLIFSSIYIDIMAILSALFSFIGFYYYDIFKSKIDIFIFGLKDDDTSAIFSIIFKDYPIALIVACVVAFSAFCVWLNNKILIPPPRNSANLANPQSLIAKPALR